MKKKVLWLGILIIGFSLLGADIEKSIAQKNEESFYKELELFTDALSIIRKNHVSEVKAKPLIYGALRGMLSSLDSYSQFLDPDFYKEMQIETEGRFGGLGIIITIKDDFLTVVSPLEDTPADRTGIKPGDQIIKIDDELTRGITVMEAAKKLRGEKGTTVKLEVMREKSPELLKFTIMRDIIKVKSIKKSHFISGTKIGYVRIVEFQKRTADDLKTSLQELEKEGLEGLILDLRNNPGGLLDSAIDVADEFIEKGKLVVYTQGRDAEDKRSYYSKNEPILPGNVPLVILMNKGSASASEIVIGAVHDWKRGVLVGTKTFGKGSVQNIIPLADGSALKLTIAKYYTPEGICIEETGINPDVLVELPEPKEADKDKEMKDLQLERAIELLKEL
ncbi:MAG: S41 family peptidase [bacterium (Candidatus Ratteibacteria) CG_4_9_14_3_um_filter_41_21]|uniref:S41 family peptidase n=3 Tax=Candidatus Ratteibacteria TaxID=2979319 RepID=A0A2M7EAG9_9BACT|nr:MAG: S41 family peptidase [bacterium (Candidatus Ratteibacteria) CG01_land_8_20_14_3_00_40_19]PIW31370.1 MAG: S41 family peptidase [bacterium (Candidatus Ratteibacteria) CG15_BIG_FIL_POST_REV_8_21_14_020_41_12]PIW73843.1 MAG: S41 family peptidase [bacterium (Candidatus Ratteibacteria) CG_4_8_14_3_um_filter_41_36]PJA62108.1 MAG: S41 family peptidase [bacterium (Candidatus Ratteibacteria) CG_4_9_14_3_um_filter_41_21]